MNILSVGGAIPPPGYYWTNADEFITLEKQILYLKHILTAISIGRDSYKVVFEILKKHRLNIPIGIHSKCPQEDIQHILDIIKENGWEEYCDLNNYYCGRYKTCK